MQDARFMIQEEQAEDGREARPWPGSVEGGRSLCNALHHLA